MTHKSSAERLIRLGVWMALVALALTSLRQWRRRNISSKSVPNLPGPDTPRGEAAGVILRMAPSFFQRAIAWVKE